MEHPGIFESLYFTVLLPGTSGTERGDWHLQAYNILILPFAKMVIKAGEDRATVDDAGEVLFDELRYD